MSLLVTLAMSASAAMPAPAVDPNVSFVSSYAPYRVLVSEHCASGRCLTTARVERSDPDNPGELICADESIAFPTLPVVASRWEMESGSPVMQFRVLRGDGTASAEAKFHPNPDCTSYITITRDAS
jgi:hypothetical protein